MGCVAQGKYIAVNAIQTGVNVNTSLGYDPKLTSVLTELIILAKGERNLIQDLDKASDSVIVCSDLVVKIVVFILTSQHTVKPDQKEWSNSVSPSTHANWAQL